jgi:hypothetical protein
MMANQQSSSMRGRGARHDQHIAECLAIGNVHCVSECIVMSAMQIRRVANSTTTLELQQSRESSHLHVDVGCLVLLREPSASSRGL